MESIENENEINLVSLNMVGDRKKEKPENRKTTIFMLSRNK